MGQIIPKPESVLAVFLFNHSKEPYLLNEVQIEGIIAKEPWKYDRNLFFRVASYRDADMPAKPDITPGRDEPDYINVRVPGGATSLMPTPRATGCTYTASCKAAISKNRQPSFWANPLKTAKPRTSRNF